MERVDRCGRTTSGATINLSRQILVKFVDKSSGISRTNPEHDTLHIDRNVIMLVLNVDDYRIHRDKHRDGAWDALPPFSCILSGKEHDQRAFCIVCVCPGRQG